MPFRALRQPRAPRNLRIMAAIGCLFVGRLSLANWIPLGPEGGPTGAIVADPVHRDTLFAVDSDAIWKTVDRGTSWTRFASPLSDMQTMAISPSNPDVMYAGGYYAIAKTTDGGLSWAGLGTLGAFAHNPVFGLTVDPRSPDVVYATSAHGLFQSTNGGLQWTGLAATLGDYFFSVVALSPDDPSVVFAGTIGGTTSLPGGLFRSTNGGRDWVRISPPEVGQFVYGLIVTERDPSTFYLATEQGVFKSVNGGASWTAASSGIEIAGIALQADVLAGDPADANVLYAGTAFGAFVTTNGGQSWREITQIQRRVTALAVDRQSVAYASSVVDGVVRSADRGKSWNAANGNRRRVMIDTIRVARTGAVYATNSDIGVLKLEQNGQWVRTNNGFPEFLRVRGVVLDPFSATTVYAWTDGGVYKSLDGGSSWQSRSRGVSDPAVFSLAIDPRNHDVLYAGTADDGIFKSVDGGLQWSPLTGSPPGTFAMAIDPQNPSVVYAATELSGVVKTIDGGMTWTKVNNGLSNLVQIRSVAISPRDPPIVLIGAASGSGRSPGMFRTTNGGASWTHVDFPSGGARILDLAVDDTGSMVYAASAEHSLLRSTDAGVTWTAVSGGPIGINSVAIGPDRAYVGTFGDSVFAVTAETPRRRAVRPR